MARKPLAGRGRFRKLLRRLPAEFRNELLVELYVTGRQIRQAVQAKTPRKSGRLARGISERVLRTSLRLQVGLIGTPAARAKLFYGRIQDLGRVAQVVNVQAKRRRTEQRLSTGQLVTLMQAPRRDRKRMRRGTGALNRGQLREVGSAYKMQVPASPAKRFVTGSYPDLRRTLNDNLRGIFGRALVKIGGGDE